MVLHSGGILRSGPRLVQCILLWAVPDRAVAKRSRHRSRVCICSSRSRPCHRVLIVMHDRGLWVVATCVQCPATIAALACSELPVAFPPQRAVGRVPSGRTHWREHRRAFSAVSDHDGALCGNACRHDSVLAWTGTLVDLWLLGCRCRVVWWHSRTEHVDVLWAVPGRILLPDRVHDCKCGCLSAGHLQVLSYAAAQSYRTVHVPGLSIPVITTNDSEVCYLLCPPSMSIQSWCEWRVCHTLISVSQLVLSRRV